MPAARWRRCIAIPGRFTSPGPKPPVHGTALHVLVELQAPGYPGSTYTLHYEPQRDQLEGSYFQAALQQRFAVVFVRMK